MPIAIIISTLIMLLTLTSCQTSEALSSAALDANQTPAANQVQERMAQASVSSPDASRVTSPVNPPVPTAPPVISSSALLSEPTNNPDSMVASVSTSVSTSSPTSTSMNVSADGLNSNLALAGETRQIGTGVDAETLSPRPKTQKTYLINGLMSAVPFIGYGFRNLHKKMPEAQLFSYLSPIESAGVIMPKVMGEIEAAYAQDPNVSINLIGISLGADFVSIVAEKLHKKGIPVNYLGIVDGTSLRPIQANVKKADNLTCTFLDCVRGRVRLAPGNSTTVLFKKKYKSSHIPLGDNADLHAHVIAQSRS